MLSNTCQLRKSNFQRNSIELVRILIRRKWIISQPKVFYRKVEILEEIDRYGCEM